MKKLISFIRDRRGAVFIIIALCFVSMAGVVASALDYSRGSLLRSDLVAALDSAALAGGTVANGSNLNATINKYFNVNMPANYLGATIDPLTIQQAADKSTLTVSSAAHLRNAMMEIVNWNMTNVAAASQVTIERKGMELVMVLDNTGSMSKNDMGGGTTRLQSLQTASNNLLNILYGNKDVLDNFWVGVVPFSQAVNIGSTRTSWTSGSSSYSPTTWAGCVEARETSGRDVTDDPPSVALFPKYYSACFPMTGSYQTWWNAWYGTNTSSSPPARTNCSTSSGWQYRSGISTTSAYGPNQYCPSTAVLSMTASKTTVANKLNTMTAGGDTNINLGLVWGWRLLSPKWRYTTGTSGSTTLWGGLMGDSSKANYSGQALPLDYNTPLMNKVVILLSDGDNQMLPNNYTAYGQLSTGRVGATSQSGALTKLDAKTTAVCNSLKANGVIIYTIALSSDVSSDGEAILKGCASNPEYYFESPTGADLQDAFTTIGDSLSNLRISQ